MGFFAWIGKIQHALHKYAESIRDGEKREKEPCLPPDKPVEVRAVVSYDENTVANAKAQAESEHATQKSIKKAAWSAFVAASIYALIAAYQANEMRKATVAATGQLVEAVRQTDVQRHAFWRQYGGVLEVHPIGIGGLQPSTHLVQTTIQLFEKSNKPLNNIKAKVSMAALGTNELSKLDSFSGVEQDVPSDGCEQPNNGRCAYTFSKTLSPDEYKEFIAGTKRLYIWGEISYGEFQWVAVTVDFWQTISYQEYLSRPLPVGYTYPAFRDYRKQNTIHH